MCFETNAAFVMFSAYTCMELTEKGENQFLMFF